MEIIRQWQVVELYWGININRSLTQGSRLNEHSITKDFCSIQTYRNHEVMYDSTTHPQLGIIPSPQDQPNTPKRRSKHISRHCQRQIPVKEVDNSLLVTLTGGPLWNKTELFMHVEEPAEPMMSCLSDTRLNCDRTERINEMWCTMCWKQTEDRIAQPMEIYGASKVTVLDLHERVRKILIIF